MSEHQSPDYPVTGETVTEADNSIGECHDPKYVAAFAALRLVWEHGEVIDHDWTCPVTISVQRTCNCWRAELFALIREAMAIT